MADKESRNYVIKEIRGDGTVIVKFEYDDEVQSISGAPVDSPEALQEFLATYLDSYVAGKKLEQQEAPEDVQALVGQTFEARQPESAPAADTTPATPDDESKAEE